jgi:hypothetical protein
MVRAGAALYGLPARDLLLSILAGILVIVLASFVLAYFAARTWHWAYVLVGVGIVIFSALFFVLSAETLRIHAVLRSDYHRKLADVEKVDAQIAALERGAKDQTVINQLRGLEFKIPEDADLMKSLADLEHDLSLLTQARGPMWKSVAPAGVDAQTGAARINITEPTPSGLAPDSVVYLFEQGAAAQPDPRRGAQYLGEFRVQEVSGQQAVLQPVVELNDEQKQRLGAGRGPWVMHETMPPDQHQIFAGLSEEQLRERLPADAVEEYLRDGKATNPDDDPLRIARYDEADKLLPPEAEGQPARTEFLRRLRNYAVELRQLTERRAILLTQLAGVQLEIQRVADALASAERLAAFRQDEANKLTSDLAGLTRERQAVDRLLAMVQQQLDTIRVMLDDTLRENSRLVRELAARQTAAARQLDQAAAPAEPAAPVALGRAN